MAGGPSSAERAARKAGEAPLTCTSASSSGAASLPIGRGRSAWRVGWHGGVGRSSAAWRGDRQQWRRSSGSRRAHGLAAVWCGERSSRGVGGDGERGGEAEGGESDGAREASLVDRVNEWKRERDEEEEEEEEVPACENTIFTSGCSTRMQTLLENPSLVPIYNHL